MRKIYNFEYVTYACTHFVKAWPDNNNLFADVELR